MAKSKNTLEWERSSAKPPMKRKDYEKELRKLQVELCKLQDWVKFKGLRVVVVMEGRDIGTAVFPHADVKVFLDADARIRAERRVAQNGTHTPEEARRIVEDLVLRDQRDRTRAVSPLVAAPDAVILDTTHLSIDEVVAAVEQLALAKLGY